MSDATIAALASTLPGGIRFDVTDDETWRAQEIATFQALKLTEAGYRLVCEGDTR